MLFGNRRPRKSDARRRSLDIHRPQGEQLEDRTLLSIDLGGTAPTANPLIATAPFGFAFGGSTTTTNGTVISGGGAGWSVSDLGDVNGDGYDDFLIGGPTTTGAGVLGTGLNGAAYLIFGSNSVGQTQITDWLGTNTNFPYAANNRVGDLGQLGLPTQTNPINNASLAPTPFSGITFVTSSDLTSALGASVSSVRLSNGTYGILIGAPNAISSGGIAGTGRAYFITSSNWSSFIGQTIDLSAPTPPSGMNVVTFVNSISGGQLGYSVAGGFNIFGDNSGDVILGAPGATYVTNNGGTGAVFVVDASGLAGSTQTIDVSTQIGQGGNSVIFIGSSGSQTGWSVADGGDVNGVTAGGSNVDDILIGAPNQSGGGAAYLVYGGANLPSLAQTVTISGTTFRYINLVNVGATTGTGGGTAVPGATILGPTASRTGQAVSSGGDFNSDNFGDILIGSPEFSSSSTVTNNGLATLLYGAASTSTGYLTGTITLGNTPSGISPLYMTGATSGSLAGYAVSPVGLINSGQPSLILVGAPGFNNNSGSAYLIPGRTGGLTGTQSLANAELSPLSGVQFKLTTPNSASTSPPFFGASVSSRFQSTTFTADSDSKADFIIGAPGYDVTQDSTRILAGGAMIVQGGLIPVPIPGTTQITTQIGVGTPFAPFSINATTPANLQIYVFGTTTANGTFMPVRDINPATVVVNGVAFPNATLLADPNQADWVNGIQDAIITITPRSALGLTNGTNTITIKGQTLSTSPLAGETWTGSASVAVTGSSSGGGPATSALAGLARGPVLETTFNSFFGPTQYVPTISQLSAYNYAPIPTSVALQQYQPAPGFNDRIYNFNHPGKHLKNYLTIRGPAATGLWGYGSGGPGPSGLDYRRRNFRTFIDNQILDRSRFHQGRSYQWTHGGLPKIDSIYHGVVPVQLTTEHIAQVPGVKANGDRQIGRAPDSGATFRSVRRGQGM
jgi:hypothetical protein